MSSKWQINETSSQPVCSSDQIFELSVLELSSFYCITLGDICGSLGKVGFTMMSNEGHHVCITLSRTLKSWQDARTQCKAEGGDLAVVNNRKMDSYVEQMLQGHISYVHGKHL